MLVGALVLVVDMELSLGDLNEAREVYMRYQGASSASVQ